MTAKETKNSRPRIALITNHGYAGVEIPVGGAPDTGGQNFYVNSLALALEEVGYEVTIFARGGFPFFGQDRLREGTEKLSTHIRYVYIPGGGNTFLRKEDIAIALDEETTWLANFVEEEAAAANSHPCEYYQIINTHYWDAAVIATKLVERWKDSIAYRFLSKIENGIFKEVLSEFDGGEKHRQSLSREIDLHTAEIAAKALPGRSLNQIAQNFLPSKTWSASSSSPHKLADQIALGKHLLDHWTVEGTTLLTEFERADTHVWTPHSMGIIKERNFWNKDPLTVQALKFRERDSHEQVICMRTPRFCSTSEEITRALVAYQGVSPASIFDFPPCLDTTIFKPRSKDELDDVYTYLSDQSGIPKETLLGGQILFETSRMDRTKRKDILLRAFAKVAETKDNVYLFIGGGPAGNPIFKELEELKSTLPSLKGRGFLLGFIPDDVLAPLFSVADLFVSASEMEGFGMSVSQAAAARVAVVSSDLIPFATQFSKGAAVLVEAGDVDGFADAIRRLLDDEVERNRRADELLKVALELNWTATARRFIDWYHEGSR